MVNSIVDIRFVIDQCLNPKQMVGDNQAVPKKLGTRKIPQGLLTHLLSL